jgi:putative effector of murein hydrolase LrgA (UPF0299 family)
MATPAQSSVDAPTGLIGLSGLAWLLGLQSVGELLSRGLALPFPGPVIGMLLLLIALRWKVVQEPVAACAGFLLAHLSLLFVPVGVGVMTHLALVSQYGGRMLLVVVLSTLVGMVVTVLVMNAFRDKPSSASADNP